MGKNSTGNYEERTIGRNSMWFEGDSVLVGQFFDEKIKENDEIDYIATHSIKLNPSRAAMAEARSASLDHLAKIQPKLTQLKEQKMATSTQSNSLETESAILQKAFRFYQKTYGVYMVKDPSDEKLQRKTLKSSTPSSVLLSLRSLGINPKETHLYFFAKLLYALPLPPFWRKTQTNPITKWIYENKVQITFESPPVLSYLKKSIHFLRQKTKRQGTRCFERPPDSTNVPLSGTTAWLESNTPSPLNIFQVYASNLQREEERESQMGDESLMTFQDSIGRLYKVDMKAVYEKAKFEGENSIENNPELLEASKLYEKESNDLGTNEAEPQYGPNEPLEPISMRQWVLREGEALDPNLSDIHLIILAYQLRLNIESNIHLVGVIDNFVQNINRGAHKWHFRMNNQMQCYWVNHHLHSASTVYPYLEELKEALDNFQDGTKNQPVNSFEKKNTWFDLFCRMDAGVTRQVNELRQEAISVLQNYHVHKHGEDWDASSSKEDIVRLEIKRIARKLKEIIGVDLGKNEILSMIFFNKFPLDHFIKTFDKVFKFNPGKQSHSF